MSSLDYFNLHRKLIIKAIEELQFEEIFKIEFQQDYFNLRVSEEINYSFFGRISVWGNLQIKEDTFTKYKDGNVVSEYTLGDFFYEVKGLCKMTDETLAQFIEEGNQTIFSDLILSKTLEMIEIDEIATFNFKSIDQILSGHPKLIMNKGRLGWGRDEIKKYSPESRNSFQVYWCAVKKDCVELGFDKDKLTLYEIYQDSLSENDIKLSREKVESLGLCFEDYVLIPVHPWQWSKYINVQFSALIYKKSLIPIGCIGTSYTPQISIRTLSSSKKRSKYDLKLAISILNTSCVRGIPQKYIKNGYKLSQKIEEIISNDDFLIDKMIVLKEVAAMSCSSIEFNRIIGGSYRYKELFGSVWRENVESKIEDDEIAIPTAALLITKLDKALIAKYIKQSGVNCKKWLEEYFKVVVIPLYHLQLEHGLGLVAHGQNTIVVLKNGMPKKLVIKDFHGDFRMATNSKHINEEFGVELDKLLPKHLIHDLITGHFITVLRYLSRIVEEYLGFIETEFYHLLGEIIANYQEGKKINTEVNLLKLEFEKVLVNSVRFMAGYSETAKRLKPMLGNNIKNPLLSIE